MLSCAKSSEDNINDGVANTKENLEDTLEDNNDTAVDLENALGGGGSGNSSSCNNSKASIVGNAVTKKCSGTDCPKSKIVIWDLDGCMTVVGESVMGAVDAASHNNSIYIADDAGFYWIVGADNKIEKKQINYPSGYKNSEITGISVNSIGAEYVTEWFFILHPGIYTFPLESAATCFSEYQSAFSEKDFTSSPFFQ